MRKRSLSRIGELLAAAVLGAVAVGAPAALAQSTDDPSSAQYQAGIPDQGTAGATASSNDGLQSNIGALPFTGLDLLIVAGVALVLTGSGFALRRLSQPPRS
jgi:hypothetical protein